MVLTIGCLLVGIALGSVVKIVALVPVTILAAVVIAIDMLLRGFGLGRALVMIVIAMISLDIGYLVGASSIGLISRVRRSRATIPVVRTDRGMLPGPKTRAG